MTLDTFKKLLSKRPFEPFRVVMSSGEKYDIKHPKAAWLTRHTFPEYGEVGEKKARLCPQVAQFP